MVFKQVMDRHLCPNRGRSTGWDHASRLGWAQGYTISCNSEGVSEVIGLSPRSASLAAGKPSLAQRPLVTGEQAAALVSLFKMLGNDTRLRLLHVLHRQGEVTVGGLAEQVQMRPQAVSNQLQRLADRSMVAARRDGNRIFYSIADPCLPAVLELALCLIEDSATDGR
ncbi:metalloregulator ArsR/SmtB family transcription factor [Nocardia ninae]|uniref:HTH arsR-type domain-containing protein n=1 Tax=Nocardia ninae NBRC 108245 TaxID=1210091 RepID=A0A511M9R6_9NOCA|nr:metalloregulator ArsR/SmtB family transcription factor [Nocardia ninae]GEM36466.1 hypothetical protein NN4_09850 [Nocardia ninae NBRC 108245]